MAADWGSKGINKYYNRNAELMHPNTVEAPKMDLPVQTKESIQDQIRGFMNPAYSKALKSLSKMKDYERSRSVSDPNSRGASSNRGELAADSDWYKSARRNLDVGETFARSALSNNYLSTVAKNTADQFNRYLDRRADYDVANSSMALNTDIYNSQVKDAFEEMLYEQAKIAARRR